MSNENVLPIKLGGSAFPQKNLYSGFSAARDYIIELQKEGYYTISVVSAPKGMSDLVLEGERYLRDPSYKDKISDSIVRKAAENCGGDKKRFAKLIKDGIMELYSPEIMKMGSYGGRLVNEMEEEVERLRISFAEDEDAHVRKALPENHSGRWLSGMLNDAGIESVYLDGMRVGVKADHRGVIKRPDSVVQIRNSLKGKIGYGKAPVAGGYIGINVYTGQPIILGRQTTDATELIVAKALDAVECENIKDVPGVYRIEPKTKINGNTIEVESTILDRMSSDEVILLSGRGSMVVHPDAVDIAREGLIKIKVKDLNKESKGTTIFPGWTQTSAENPVAAISVGKYYVLSVNDHIITLPEPSLGYMHAITGALLDHRASYADDNSEGSIISLAFPEKPDGKTKLDIEGLSKGVEAGLRKEGFNPNYVGYDEAVGITFVGDSIKGTPGVTTRISGVFAKEDISIIMGGHGNEKAGPTCISYYVDVKDAERAIKALCKELF